MNKAGEQPTITQSLEPCPFCEGDAAIQDRSGCRGYTTSSRYQPPIYVPVCVDCDASIDQFGTKAEAIAAWNTRTTSLAAQDGLVEANKQLRMALGDLLSWFPDKPTKPHWQIEAGEQGADDAITYARDLIEKGTDGNDAV